MRSPEEVAREVLGCSPTRWTDERPQWWPGERRDAFERCARHPSHKWPCPWLLRVADLIRARDAELIAHARTDVPDLTAEVERLRALIGDLADPDPCSFDHHGGCQAHGYLSLEHGEACPQAEARALLDPPTEGERHE